MDTTEVVFELFESGLDFPTCTVGGNDLFYGQRKVSGEQSHPLGSMIDLHHTDLALERFEHKALRDHLHLSALTIEVDLVGLSRAF